MSLQSAATVAKKSLAGDKITACVKQICLLGVICKVSNRKTLSGKTFCFLEKRCYQYLNFVLRGTYELLIGPRLTFLECVVIFLLSDWSTLSKWPRLR